MLNSLNNFGGLWATGVAIKKIVYPAILFLGNFIYAGPFS